MTAVGPPTIRDLAADLGLNISTVSRGLRGNPRVAAATRERICRRAEAIGYRPDPSLARLARHRWAGKRRPEAVAIALLTPRRNCRKAGYLKQMPLIAKGMGYHLREVALADFATAEELENHLLAGGIHGIVFAHAAGMQALPDLNWSRYAVLETGSVAFDHPFDRVGVDAIAQMELALSHMIAAGYRRIGVVHTPILVHRDRIRRAALAMIKEQHGLRVMPEHVVPHQPKCADRVAFASWLRQHRPQALLLPRAHIADKLLHDVEAPPPCALIADVGDVRDYAHVRVDLPAIGQRAIEQLHDAISHGRFGIPDFAASTLIRPHWVDGPSLYRR